MAIDDHFLGEVPVVLRNWFPVSPWECHAMEKRCEIMSLVFYSVKKKTARISTHVHFCDSRLLDFYHDSTPQYILLLHLLQNALLLNPSSKCTSCVTTFDLLFWFTTDGFFPAIISAFLPPSNCTAFYPPVNTFFVFRDRISVVSSVEGYSLARFWTP